MRFQRLLIALTVVNMGLLLFLLVQIEVRFLGFRVLLRSAEVSSAGSVLRGRGLEITDDDGRVRASIKLHPASVLPDGTIYPETVLLRWINSQGRPTVKSLLQRMVRRWPSAAILTQPMLRLGQEE